MNYAKTIAAIIDKEKGYVDHPSDRGGPTNWGITQAVARNYGYLGTMQDMPRSVAEGIYMMRYIMSPRFDKIAAMSPLVGEELIDTGVNMGPATASILFQRLLNAFNARSSKYADLFVDGNVGPASMEAFKKYLAWRGPEGEAVMVKALNHIQGARYLDITEKNESQEDFFYGWIKNRT